VDPPAGSARDARGLLAILLALAVGAVGMHLVYAGWLPVASSGRLPADAHIGPVSWALVLAGLAFGLGMVVSGSCISAHWYRLGEGSATSVFALVGAAAGFVLGFNSWNLLYLQAIATAQPLWLPAFLGHSGSVLATLLALALLAVWWTRQRLPQPPQAQPAPRDWRELGARVFAPQRWPFWVGGQAVGWLSTLVLLRLRPLGVTAALGGGAREAASALGLAPPRLEGLDQLGGCATRFDTAFWQSPNAVLVGGIVGGSLLAALLSRQFALRVPGWRQALRGLGGGVLLGWGAMVGLGCTVGTLMSGIMAGAVSGWVFAAAVVAAVWGGIRLGWAPPR
jgi:uncharacterized membrane protein YedE/YeeE